MLNKNINLIILSILVFLVSLSTFKVLFTPIKDYGLFLSGLYNILSNYIFLISILGVSLLLIQSKNKLLFFILTIFLFIFILCQIFFNIILDFIFYYNIDFIFGFDKFPLIILYILNIFIGILLWFSPHKIILKYLIVILFSFISSLHIGLKDIEAFSIKSFINYPGGNIIIIIMLTGLVIYIFEFISRKYIFIGSKIFGSWLVVIGIISCLTSIIY